MPQDPIVVNLGLGKSLKLTRKGKDLQLEALGEEPRIIGKDDTLVIEGNGKYGSLSVDDNAPFIPRVQIKTEMPLRVEGSVRVASNSTQGALLDLTSVEFTSVNGVDVTRVRKNPDTSAGAPQKLMDHKLGVPEKMLSFHEKETPQFPEGSKVLEYKVDGKKRHAVVEPGGGRIDVINGKDGDRQMFSLMGLDSTDTTERRFNRGSNNEMELSREALRADNGWGEVKFAVRKDQLGIPESQLRGDVEVKLAGPVSADIPAFVDIPGFEPRQTEVKPEQKKFQRELIQDAEKYLRKYPRLVEGKIQPLDNKHKVNPGLEMGIALENIKDAAQNLFHENTGEMNDVALRALHDNMDNLSQLTGDVYQQYKDDSRKSLDKVSEKAADIGGAFQKHQHDAYELGLGRPPERKSKRTGMLDGLELPGGMPKLLVADAAEGHGGPGSTPVVRAEEANPFKPKGGALGTAG